MKKILCAIVVILLLPFLLHAVEIPELDEWWSIEGAYIGRVFSYLPDFDPLHGGRHALAIYTHNDLSPTWYFRYYGDTVNHFSWPSNSVGEITKVDLNGDGVKDYVTTNGSIYPGVQSNSLPAPSVAKYFPTFVVSGRQRIVLDINNDGYEDILSPQGDYDSFPNKIFTILIGGPDLGKLKTVDVPIGSSNEYFLDAFPKKPGDTTLKYVTVMADRVAFVTGLKWYSIILREIKVENTGDTVKIDYATLDSLSFQGYVSSLGYWELGNARVFVNRPEGKAGLIVRHGLRELGEPERSRKRLWYTKLYELQNNRLNEVQSNPVDTLAAWMQTLYGDLNGDGYNDWCVMGWDKTLYFYRGLHDGIDSIPFAKYPFRNNNGYYGFTVLGIGDVTGDGLLDIGIGFNGDQGRFSIIQGRAIQSVGVIEEQNIAVRTFDMQQNYPNPVGSDRRIAVPITVEKPQHLILELWTLTGQKIDVVHEGWMPTGVHKLDVDLLPYQLPSGVYLMRLTGAESTRERAVFLR